MEKHVEPDKKVTKPSLQEEVKILDGYAQYCAEYMKTLSEFASKLDGLWTELGYPSIRSCYPKRKISDESTLRPIEPDQKPMS